MTQIISSISEWEIIRKNSSSDVGFVPTMGNLHQGHLSLLQKCSAENDISVLSIFVNPTQFNDPQDFKNYPKTFDADVMQASHAGIQYVFCPTGGELYPDHFNYQMTEQQQSLNLEGGIRPGHFSGMLTVVLKLLNIIRAKRAYFGEKDFQQLQLVKGMAQAFFLPTEIVGCPIIRNEFGLPLSSRNNRLTREEYELANCFPRIFHGDLSCEAIKAELLELGFEVDYVEEYEGRRFGAVRVGAVRLIDNIALSS